MVGDGLDSEGFHLAVAAGGHLCGDVVVAGEGVGNEVFHAVFDPLDGLACQERGGDGENVAGIDRHLASEAAADVGRYDADLVLGQSQVSGDEREYGADGVRGLGGHPDGQLFLDRVPLGDAAARLDGGDVDAGYVDVFFDGDVALSEGAVGGGAVAGLPVPDVVALLLFVFPDDSGVRLKGLEGVHHDGQRLVFHLDGADAIGGRVAVGGENGCHLLTVELDGVHGEHHLGVSHEGGHPR